MAASGFTPISLYYSTTASAVPTSGNLANGELGLNIADMKLYAKNSAGVVTLLAASTGATGTVSSVALSGGTTGFTVSGSPITTSGTITLAGTLAIANGGTGQTTANAAFNALVPSQTGNSGKYLTTDGSNTSWGTNPLGTVTSVAASVPSFLSIAGSPITTSGTLAISLSGTALPTTSGGTGLTSFTSGGVVYASSSSALATGSALNFNGTSLGIGSSSYGDAGSITASIGVAGTTSGGLQLFASSAQEHFIQWGDATSGSGTYAGAIGYSHASDYMRFYVASAEALRLTSTSLYTASGINVGIGTSSPAYKLHAVKTGGGIVGRFDNADGVADIYGYGLEVTRSIAYIKGSGALHLGSAAGYSAVVLDSAGNLGLGVTPSAWDTALGSRAIQFTGGSVFNYRDTNLILTQNAYFDGAFKYYASSIAAGYYDIGSGTHKWFTAPSGTAGNAISFTQAMTLHASGGFGVGSTSDPGNGQMIVAGTGNAGINVRGASGNASYIFFTESSVADRYLIGTPASSGDLVFRSAAYNFATGTERMRLDSSGNLLVGGTAARGTTLGSAHLDLFNGTAPAGTLTNGVSLYSSSGDLKFMNAAGDAFDVGYRNIPQNAQTGNYTLTLADSGDHIYHAVGAGAATYTIPANSSVAYPIGTAITFINMAVANVTIAITTDTMYLSSAGTTGSRTLAQYGSATAIKITSTNWLISGSGLT